jgi:hypothetical protein
VRKFEFLLAGYEALGGSGALSFGEWLILNDITHPQEFTALMWLWWAHLAPRQTN